jgi:hypothetical protein
MLFLQPAGYAPQENASESWASAGAFCVGATVAAGAVAYSMQPKKGSDPAAPTPRAPRAALRAAERAALAMTATADSPECIVDCAAVGRADVK